MTDNSADAAAKQQQENAKKHEEATRKRLADEREAREKTSKSATKDGVAGSTPTPTQEENDLHASGVPVTEHEDDGSGPDPNVPGAQTKESEANKPPQQRGGYATRTVAPAKHE